MIATNSGKPIYYANKPATVHQYGGARLANSDTSGVVNEQGEVYSNPGLYVADASALAQGVGGPPSITVCTWAAHVADCIGKYLLDQSDSYQHRELINIQENSIKGFSFSQLDTLFASLPQASSEDPLGEFAGQLVMVRGLNWLPKILRAFIVKAFEPALFRGWYGKYLCAGKGHNIFRKGNKKKSALPFMFIKRVSSDGSSIVHQLNYDIPENGSKVKPILGEAKRLNKNTYLARMYYKKTKLVYYLLSAG